MCVPKGKFKPRASVGGPISGVHRRLLRLRSRRHVRFSLHPGQRIPPGERMDMERLARYCIRNPFSFESTRLDGHGSPILYRSERIRRSPQPLGVPGRDPGSETWTAPNSPGRVSSSIGSRR